MVEVTSSEIEQRAQALAQLAGEIWQRINEAARNHYRALARRQLERDDDAEEQNWGR